MSRKSDIVSFIQNRLDSIKHSPNEQNALLATLRKGVGKSPGEIPQVLGILLEDIPESFMSTDGKPTKEEWACYLALTLFAWHQQGYDTKNNFMHTTKRVSLGDAFNRLALSSEDSNAKDRIKKKLEVIVTSKDVEELSYHLRNAVKLLQNNGIQLNYSQLAGDIYEWQFNDRRKTISFKWGQDFYKINGGKNE